MDTFLPPIGFYPADILLPRQADLSRWAVVACDQFTSEPDYWRTAAALVGDAPSTLSLILPEVYLKETDVERRIAGINDAMQRYLREDVFRTLSGSLVYLERRQSDGRIRRGLVGMVDLECYDFTPGSDALIRATEGTVLQRIPPRVRVRQDAPMELPHVMLLIDDPDRTVIEPLSRETAEMPALYDFDLMQRGGHLCGRQLTQRQIRRTLEALAALATPEQMERKYGLRDKAPLLFAVGDGNHSLATAKACYEAEKKAVPESEWAALPSRYALVEVVNNHDDALQFEPIHRVLFGVEPEAVLAAMKETYPDLFEGRGEGHVITLLWQGREVTVTVPHPRRQLAVGTLQAFLDDYCRAHGVEVDYIHGDDVVRKLSAQPGNMGFLLPAMGKEELFRTVMADGVLPRKTFSMGHAQDKRYYMEARRIRRTLPVTENACAKVNLLLNVGERRADGYHGIETVMTAIDLADQVTLTPRAQGITLRCDSVDVPAGADNLACKAAAAFFAHTGLAGGVEIGLTKRIPTQAGLGGGSSDAAAVLRGLRRLYCPTMPLWELEAIGLTVGSDVPFCIRGGAALATGRGEILQELPMGAPLYLAVCKGRDAFSTAEMYRRIDAQPARAVFSAEAMAAALRQGDAAAVVAAMGNRFEDVLPADGESVGRWQTALRQGGALGAVMTGSGAAVFGLFPDEESAAAFASNAPTEDGDFVCAAKTV